MTSLFHRPKAQEPAPPPEQPKTPTIDEATKIREEEDSRLRRKRRSRAAMMLTGPTGDGGPQTSAPVLTGGSAK